MATQTLYPLNTDTFESDEVIVEDNVKAEIVPTSIYNKAIGIYQFINGITTDDSSASNNITVRAGGSDITLYDDPEKGGVALLDGTTSLTHYDSTIFFGEAKTTKLVCDVEFYRDVDTTVENEIVSIRHNGVYIRLLASGTTFYFQVFYNGGNFVKTYTSVSYKEWHRATFFLNVNTTTPTISIQCYLDGTYQESLNVAVATNTTVGYICIGGSQSNTNRLKGRLKDVYISNQSVTTDELLFIHTNKINKYKSENLFTFDRDFTSTQMTALLNMAQAKIGAGSLAFNISKDSGVTWLRYISGWTNTGTGYNSIITVADHIGELDILDTQTLRVRVAMISDGWQDVGFEYIQLTYKENVAPEAIFGASRFCILGQLFYPFNSSYIYDEDKNISQIFYKFDFQADETEIFQGLYATWQDAVDNTQIDTTGFPLGEIACYIRVVDSLGAEKITHGTIYIVSETDVKLDSILAQLTLIKSETDKIQTIDDNVDSTITAIGNLNDFDPANDVVAHVTLVDTTTTNSDMVTPPDNASISAIKTQTDKLQFSVDNDIKATLDGETVSTTFDLSTLALESSVQTIDNNIDTIQLRVEDLHDHFFAPADFGDDGIYIGYRKNGDQFFQARMKNIINVATNQNFVKREIVE